MINENNISIGALKVRPIDPSSKLSHEKVGEDLFDERHDFLVFNKMTHVAVLLTIVNDTVFTPDPGDVQSELVVTLDDETDNRILVTRKVKVTLSSVSLFTNLRADLPFTSAEVDCSHAYKVKVYLNRYQKPAAEHEMHLFRMSEVRVLPTRWLIAEAGCVVGGYPWETTAYRSPGADVDSDVAVRFMFRRNFPMADSFMPELEIRLVYPNGKELLELVRPKRVDESDDMQWRVTWPFRTMEYCSGVHYAEVRCMGYAFAGFLFDTDGASDAGEWSEENLGRIPEYTPLRGQNLFKQRGKTVADAPEKTIPTDSTDDRCAAQAMLDNLIGLTNVKKKLTEYTNLIRFSRLRADAGFQTSPVSLHSMFLGSPGTGKTTVAKIMGRLLYKAGVLSKGHVVVRERSTLIGKYYNSESENIKAALEEAKGGILFIDEAYQLYQAEDPKDPGRFVIESLLTALSDETDRDWMLILAGYTEPMKRMFEINPGLRSRIPESNIYMFDDFSEAELMEIAKRYFKQNDFVLSDGAHDALARALAHDFANRGNDFGNARHVMNLIQTCILPNMATRLASVAAPTKDQLCRVMAVDIPLLSIPARVSRPTVGFRPLPLVS